MAVMKRGGKYVIFFKPFGTKRIGLTLNVPNEKEARLTETLIMRACRTGDFTVLDDVTRSAVVKMFQNQKWELPAGLEPSCVIQETLTLWRACELFFKYPGVGESKSAWRYEIALSHLVEFFGKEQSLRSLWVPDLRQYRVIRQQRGAAPDTVNRELSTLSRLFTVMVEMQLMEHNPCRLLTKLSTKSGERQVYLSRETVQELAAKTPPWFRPILWTAYYTGMRRGEILDLKRKQINLASRMITITPEGTKEGAWKRIPIHQELAPILREVLQWPALLSGRVFPLRDQGGISDLKLETFKNPWPRACEALHLPEPWPRFHDLRHTWKTNARRSKMDPEIREAILGHSTRKRSVTERYGRISDSEYLEAIDMLTFDHGETEIFVSGHRTQDGGKDAAQQSRNISEEKKKRSCGNMT